MATATCNPNYMVSELGVVTRWTPVKNLTFSAEAMWTHLNTGFTGTATLTPAGPAADRDVPVQEPGHRLVQRPRPAQLLIPSA